MDDMKLFYRRNKKPPPQVYRTAPSSSSSGSSRSTNKVNENPAGLEAALPKFISRERPS